MTLRAILTDIEGTTSSIHFVHEVLFPYSAAALPEFVRTHAETPEIQPLLNAVADEIQVSHGDLDAINSRLLGWITEDRKHSVLKVLQGIIWQRGYREGAFKAHLYGEVAGVLQGWAESGLLLYVYSSGSIAAQKLFFKHSEAGDLSAFFQGYFDTSSGPKREAASYAAIARAMGLIPAEILFLSDIEAELDAARTAGMRTTLLARTQLTDSKHPVAADFTAINL
jgi:enolase-phosphatase E1